MMAWPSQARSVVDSPVPAAVYRYAARQRADWFETRLWRYSSLPMVIFEAERFKRTVAPASAAWHEGGIGTHRSSQISTKKVQHASGPARNINRSPNGTSVWPHSVMVSRVTEAAVANCRSS